MTARTKSSRAPCCAVAVTALFELVALAAALVAIGSTFWLEPVDGVLPGLKNAGLWRVCYKGIDPSSALSNEAPNALRNEAAPGTDVQLMRTGTKEGKAAVEYLAGADGPAVTEALIADDTASDPKRFNTTKIVRNVRDDIKNNFPFIGNDGKGCSKNMTFYNNIWGDDYSMNIKATRALTLTFAALSVVKILSMIFCSCGAAISPKFIGITTGLQVLAGWIGWLIYLWMILGIKDATDARDQLETYGVSISSKANDPSSYWGHSFWLFLASTIVSMIGSFFVTCA